MFRKRGTNERGYRGCDRSACKIQRGAECIQHDAVMPLYAVDGVFMPPYSQSAVGSAAVRKAYDAVFKAITLNVKFTIAEIVELGPGWAFARTNSAGTTTDHATGAKSAEGNQELFVLRKDDDGSWKIARYSFSPTNPPRH
jgi:uncharacterized protein (TIGR02246 family)